MFAGNCCWAAAATMDVGRRRPWKQKWAMGSRSAVVVVATMEAAPEVLLPEAMMPLLIGCGTEDGLTDGPSTDDLSLISC